MGQIQMIFVNEAPVLPLFPGPDWYEYNTTRFTGFPTKEDPYAPGPPFTAPYEHTLIVLTTIKPEITTIIRLEPSLGVEPPPTPSSKYRGDGKDVSG